MLALTREANRALSSALRGFTTIKARDLQRPWPHEGQGKRKGTYGIMSRSSLDVIFRADEPNPHRAGPISGGEKRHRDGDRNRTGSMTCLVEAGNVIQISLPGVRLLKSPS